MDQACPDPHKKPTLFHYIPKVAKELRNYTTLFHSLHSTYPVQKLETTGTYSKS